MVGIIANIHDLLGLLPEAYHQGATVAIIACVGGFLNIATGVNTSILFTSDKYLYGTYLLFLLLILAVILNIILIPIYGIEGAALATALSSVIYNVLKYFIILKKFKMQPYDTSSLKILFAFIASIRLYSLIGTLIYKESFHRKDCSPYSTSSGVHLTSPYLNSFLTFSYLLNVRFFFKSIFAFI